MTATLQVATTAPPAPQRVSLLAKIADRYGVEPAKMMDTLKATAFKVKEGAVSNEQMMALLIVADQYGLNPFTKEIYAFPDKGGIVPVVGVDGWARIINEHAQFDGMVFTMPDDGSSCTCEIYRKDRGHALSVTEYLSECKRGTQPWSSHPRRMLRHKAMIQCARMAFGFAGIYDQDEAERIRDMGEVDEVRRGRSGGLAQVRTALAAPALGAVVDMETGEAAPPPPPDLTAAAASYAQFADRLVKDAEISSLVMDEARVLPDDQYQDLLALWQAKFPGA